MYIEEFTFLEIDFFRKKVVPALADQKIFLNMLYLREYLEFFHIWTFLDTLLIEIYPKMQ